MPQPIDEKANVEMCQISCSFDRVLLSDMDNEHKNEVELTADEIIQKFEDITNTLFLEAGTIRDAALELKNYREIDVEIEKISELNDKYYELYSEFNNKVKPFGTLSKDQEGKITRIIVQQNATDYFARFMKPLYDKTQELQKIENQRWLQSYSNYGLLGESSSVRHNAISATASTQNNANLTRTCVLL